MRQPDPKTCAILTSIMHVADRLPAEPTHAEPGSLEKIKILQQRAEQGVSLHHPDDLQHYPDEDHSPILQLFGNDCRSGRDGKRGLKCMNH